MGFRPGNVVNAVGGVEGGDFGDWAGGRKLDDVETAVAEDAEVLRSGDGETLFVKRAEFDGVTVEWGFEYRHGG